MIGRLSPREKELVAHCARGLDYKAVARTMGISVQTAKRYAANIGEKLGLRNAVEIGVYAVRRPRMEEWL